MAIAGVSFVGTPTGDGECFCWSVSDAEYRRIVGEERYQQEVEFRKEEMDFKKENDPSVDVEEGILPNLWTVYPNDLLRAVLGENYDPDKDYKFELNISQV